MKRQLSLLLAFIIMLFFCACQGNFGTVDLKSAVAIPEDGIIDESTVAQIKNENAIGIFTGNSNDLKYEWTIFGSDIAKIKTINLGVQLQQLTNGDIKVTLSQTENFGFSALLSITLNRKWDAQSATAYAENRAFASVSVTGSKATILNISLDGSAAEFIIHPDPLPDGNLPDNGETTVPPGEKDPYLTDPVPEGKPKPVEPENQDVNKEKAYTCTFSIECSTILNNLNLLDPDKLEIVPSNGIILPKTTVTFYEGESVFDVLQRICRENGLHMEAEWTPIYNSAYVEGIHNLYEFDCGALSGWMYRVDGWYPNYGCSRYQLSDGETVEWRYTCDLGNDIGGGYAVGG